jgi:hypothetical protein
VNNEFQRIWKEAVLTYFEALYRHLTGETDGTTGSVRIAGP